VSPPGPGTWRVALDLVREVPGGLMRVRVGGLEAPLELALRQEEEVAAFAVAVPPPAPLGGARDTPPAEPGAAPRPAPLPAAAAGAVRLGAQLVVPRPGKWLEADRTERFEVALPAGSNLPGSDLAGRHVVRVAVGAEGAGWTELALQQRGGSAAGRARRGKDGTSGASADDAAAETAASVWAGDVVLPRIAVCTVVARLAAAAATCCAGGGDGGADETVELLHLHVAPPVRGGAFVAGPYTYAVRSVALPRATHRRGLSAPGGSMGGPRVPAAPMQTA
jgi:hypothetical protein